MQTDGRQMVRSQGVATSSSITCVSCTCKNKPGSTDSLLTSQVSHHLLQEFTLPNFLGTYSAASHTRLQQSYASLRPSTVAPQSATHLLLIGQLPVKHAHKVLFHSL